MKLVGATLITTLWVRMGQPSYTERVGAGEITVVPRSPTEGGSHALMDMTQSCALLLAYPQDAASLAILQLFFALNSSVGPPET